MDAGIDCVLLPAQVADYFSKIDIIVAEVLKCGVVVSTRDGER